MGKKGGVFGGSAEFLMGDGGADAAQRAAMAQQGAAQTNYDRTASIVNPATTQALLQADKTLDLQSKNISRQEQLISQIDPTIMEASQQALKLLRGEDSSTLAPLKNSRNQQRQQLLNTLRAQLGPGAETSTAGMQALSKFDTESANVFAGAQQSSLNQMGQTAGQFNSTRPQMLNEIMGLDQISSNRAGLSFQQANLLSGAYQGVVNNSGAQYTADVMRGKQNAAFGSQMVGAAAQLGAAYMTGGASLAAGAKTGLASAVAGGGPGYSGVLTTGERLNPNGFMNG